MKLPMLLYLCCVSPVLAGGSPVDWWRAENLEKFTVYSPQTTPPPLGAIANVGFTYEAESGSPGGFVGGNIFFFSNPNYGGNWSEVTGSGHIQFDFISEVDAELNLRVNGAFGSIAMTVDGHTTVGQHPTRIDFDDPIILPPGNYHFLGAIDGHGQGPGWGSVEIAIHPVPEPSGIMVVIVGLCAWSIHRRIPKGLSFHAGVDASGTAGGK